MDRLIDGWGMRVMRVFGAVVVAGSCLAACSNGGGSGGTDPSGGAATGAVSTEVACAAAMQAVDSVQHAIDLGDSITDQLPLIDDAAAAARTAGADDLADHLDVLAEQTAATGDTSEPIEVRSRSARLVTRELLDIPDVCADLGAPFVRGPATSVGAAG